jgi:hypothetical protein
MNPTFLSLGRADKQPPAHHSTPIKMMVLICLLAISFSHSFAQTNQPPTVAISSPDDGKVFNSLTSLIITAKADDADGTITKVEFFDGGIKRGEDLTFPFSFTFTPRTGDHKFTAKATDNLGAATTSAVVSITILNRAPTIAITSPINGQSFNPLSSITITANATDADGTIAKVRFFDGLVTLGEDLIAPFTFTFTPLAGTHSLRAVAIDDLGAVTTSSVVQIIVLPENEAPVVTITSPANGQVFNSSSTITITAAAIDEDGSITKVQFFDGFIALGEDLDEPFSFTFTPLVGNHQLRAVATDSLGATTTSAVVSITVLNQAPTVAITSPTNGQVFNFLSSVTITADATDADGTIAKVEFFDGTIKVGEDLTAPFSFAFTLGLFDPLLGNHSLTAKATDNLGAATVSAAVIIVANLAPTIAITSPTNGQVFNFLSSVTITADATDADGTIAKVEFFDGTVKVGEDLATPFSFAFTPLAGNHSLTAKATDDLGQTTTSAAVSITMSNQAPTIAITAPISGQVFSSLSTVTITADATDADGTITKVEFFEGSISPTNKIGEDLEAPFTLTFSPQDGIHLLRAIATDNLGAVRGSFPIVSITVGNQFPTVAITSPTNNQVVNLTPLTIAANAADPDGTIAKVEFFDGAVKLGEDLEAPFTFTTSSPLALGNHFLTAKATDNLGAGKTSSSVRVIVINQSPNVVITSPTNGQVFGSLSSVTITADATDADGTITKVEFFEGANSPLNPSPVKLGEDVEAPYSFTFSPADGIHPIFVKAFDNLGAVRTSSVISITVGNQFPTVSFIYPANNDVFHVADTVSIFVAANDPDGTIAKVEFFDRIGFAGSTFKIGEDSEPSVNYSLTFNPLVAGDHFLTAVATDNVGATRTSSIVRISVLANSSVAPSANASQVTVAPHPFTNQTTLNNEEGTIRSIKIVDYFGNTRLQSGEVQKGKVEIGETLQPGHYILYVETDKGVSASHLIKSER